MIKSVQSSTFIPLKKRKPLSPRIYQKNKMQVYIPQGKLLGSNKRGETMPEATEALTDRHS
jgi:hypothetical protein